MTRSKRMTMAAAALAMSMAGGAFAQDRHDDRGAQGYGNQYPQQAQARVQPQMQPQSQSLQRWQPEHQGRQTREPRRYDARDGYRDSYGHGAWGDRAAAPYAHQDWHRGGYLPPQYRGGAYVVNDWRSQRLQPPPQGYQWVGTGGEFALAAIATGLIAQLIINP